MRRTILLFAAAALMLAMVATPASAIPDYPTWQTWCDMDGNPATGTGTVSTPVGLIELNGREDVPDQVALGVPGWTPGVHAPLIFFGGHFDVYVAEDDTWVFLVSGDDPTPPGMQSRVTYCLQFGVYGGYLTIWDPIWLFYSPPAIPPSTG